ncbi:MAG: energy transducer TonB [Bacteroidota bacterium]|nr:energy transducer TonB [Bacteroidota bacterium]
MTAMNFNPAMSSKSLDFQFLYQKHVLRGFLIAVTVHLFFIASYYAAQAFSWQDHPMRITVILDPSHIEPPPSLLNADIAPRVTVATAAKKAEKGIPVPIPDAVADPEATIPSQIDLARTTTTNSNSTEVGERGTSSNPSIEIDEPPPPFLPVEKQPVPIKTPVPEFPEVARRAGIEGTVWVSIWVDKFGNVRKAEVAKSTADIFNKAALDAARQWSFTPAVMNHGPVAVWVTVPFKFTLKH